MARSISTLFYVVFLASVGACSSSVSDTGNTGGAGGITTTGGGTSDGGGPGSGGSATGGSATGGSGGMMGTGGSGGSGESCMWSATDNPCPVGSYCAAPGCGAGTCEPVTNVDDPAKNPVCGCDGIDYWNDVTASNHGMAVNTSGACASPTFCGGFGGITCPDARHHCAFDVSTDGCNISDAGGSCWGMPLTCNVIGFGGGYRLCSSPKAPSCLYECDAIVSDERYFVVPQNDPNPCPR